MNKWRLIPLLFFVGLSLFLWRGLSLEPQKLPSAQIGRVLPAFSIPVLGAMGKTLTSDYLRGHVFLLTVWASWCSACVEEQVFLLQLAREGIAIYGLNYKDSPKAAQQWLHEWGNPFKQVGIDSNGRVAIDLGVYGAPETFLIDAKGVIRLRHVGILDEKTWKNDFVPYFKLTN
ncbi:MAG: thiol:disulfide interchange protein [Legionellales bacterium RIFCSPHIGHO2_12_FULL_42_9]|nr:MAG: thiol:disulfide interchange protein [Legionellales bacterium RIFCSPHIGHO2_12_FULL_42_9]